MWCPSCRADVAAELSTDNRRMLCARCQSELGLAAVATAQPSHSTSAPRTTETERNARELLARWSAQNMLDVPAPSVGAGAFAKPNGSVDLPITRTELRFDGPRQNVPSPSAAFLDAARTQRDVSGGPVEVALDGEHQDEPSGKKSRAARLAKAAVSEVPPVVEQSNTSTHEEPSHDLHHDNHEAFHQHQHQHRPTFVMMAGQICAYAGVGLLTCGTVLGMWNYFGGPAHFLPMGWLTAAVGQLLLFLGVITLIRCGLDQTITEVGWRIDFLAESVHHMESALDELADEHRSVHGKRSRPQSGSDEDGHTREAA